MSSLENMKIGKLVSGRIGKQPVVLRKTADRVDGLVEMTVIIPKVDAGKIVLLDGKRKAQPAEVVIKHKGYTLHD